MTVVMTLPQLRDRVTEIMEELNRDGETWYAVIGDHVGSVDASAETDARPHKRLRTTLGWAGHAFKSDGVRPLVDLTREDVSCVQTLVGTLLVREDELTPEALQVTTPDDDGGAE